MKSQASPLFHALQAYHEQGNIPFHTPGHKGRGRGINWEALDLSELPGLDDLHDPEGAILEAQALAAATFGAEHTFFLINGSTVGNQAMVMAACQQGESILVARNCHRSTLAGIILAGAKPIPIAPIWDPQLGTYHGISLEGLTAAIRKHPEAKAVLIVSPTYLGISSDLQAIARLTHQAGMALMVDEAHGAHFQFDSAFAMTAMKAGADLAVQSTHKTLGAFTQASMLHQQGNRISANRIKQVLSLLQSTSPSYPLMASLDLARREAQELVTGALELALKARERIQRIPGIECLDGNWCGKAGIHAYDPTKLVILTGQRGLTGEAALELLEERHIILEMATHGSMLAMVTVGNQPSDIEHLVRALSDLPTNHQAVLPIPEPPMAPRVVSITEAAWGLSEESLVQDAVGRVSAEIVAPCPPGIPLLTPGDQITPEIAQLLEKETIRVLC